MFPLSQNPSSSSSRGNGRNSSPPHNPHNRNYGAAFFQMMTIALLCTSLAQPSWLSLTTRTSSAATARSGETCPKHLTLYQFFDYGYFETGDSRNSTIIVTPVRLYYHSAAGSKYKTVCFLLCQGLVVNIHSRFAAMGCLTPAIVNVFKVILMLVIFAIIVSFIGFLLDVLGTKSRLSLTVRSNGLLTIPIGTLHNKAIFKPKYT